MYTYWLSDDKNVDYAYLYDRSSLHLLPPSALFRYALSELHYEAVKDIGGTALEKLSTVPHDLLETLLRGGAVNARQNASPLVLALLEQLQQNRSMLTTCKGSHLHSYMAARAIMKTLGQSDASEGMRVATPQQVGLDGESSSGGQGEEENEGDAPQKPSQEEQEQACRAVSAGEACVNDLQCKMDNAQDVADAVHSAMPGHSLMPDRLVESQIAVCSALSDYVLQRLAQVLGRLGGTLTNAWTTASLHGCGDVLDLSAHGNDLTKAIPAERVMDCVPEFQPLIDTHIMENAVPSWERDCGMRGEGPVLILLDKSTSMNCNCGPVARDQIASGLALLFARHFNERGRPYGVIPFGGHIDASKAFFSVQSDPNAFLASIMYRAHFPHTDILNSVQQAIIEARNTQGWDNVDVLVISDGESPLTGMKASWDRRLISVLGLFIIPCAIYGGGDTEGYGDTTNTPFDCIVRGDGASLPNLEKAIERLAEYIFAMEQQEENK